MSKDFRHPFPVRSISTRKGSKDKSSPRDLDKAETEDIGRPATPTIDLARIITHNAPAPQKVAPAVEKIESMQREKRCNAGENRDQFFVKWQWAICDVASVFQTLRI